MNSPALGPGDLVALGTLVVGSAAVGGVLMAQHGRGNVAYTGTVQEAQAVIAESGRDSAPAIVRLPREAASALPRGTVPPAALKAGGPGPMVETLGMRYRLFLPHDL